MKWHKVEDYPVGSNEYVLVSKIICGVRKDTGCFVAMLKNGRWQIRQWLIDNTKVENVDIRSVGGYVEWKYEYNKKWKAIVPELL